MDGSSWTVREWDLGDLAALGVALASRGGEAPETPLPSLEPQALERLATHDLMGQVACDQAGRPGAFAVARVEWVALGEDEVGWFRLALACNVVRGNGLDRASPLLAATRSLAQELCGPAPDGYPVVYGWPSRRFFRVAYYHLKAEVVRSQNQLRLALDDLGGGGEGIAVQPAEAFPDEADELFARARAVTAALRLRGAEDLNERFAGGRGDNRIVLARNGAGSLVGWAVHRPGRYDGRDTELVVDWLEAPGEPQAGPALRAFLTDAARADGLDTVTALFPDTAPAWRAFQDSGFRVHGTSDFLMVRSFQRPWDATWLERNWYYTLSDFED